MDQELSFLTGANAAFIADVYRRFQKDPQKVDRAWADFFVRIGDDVQEVLEELGAVGRGGPGPVSGPVADDSGDAAAAGEKTGPATASSFAKTAKRLIDEPDVRARMLDSLRALILIRWYRVRGHLMADLDPLKQTELDYHPELDPKHYGFSETDMDRPIFLDNILGIETPTLRQILSVLRETYCGTIGVEFMHVQDPAQRKWLQSRIEGIQNRTRFSNRGKRAILERLIAAEGFEKFLHKKYPGTKRFGLDGGEALIPAMEQVLKRGGQLGLENVFVGMPHRGRLNVLANFMGKPFAAIFSEFQGTATNPGGLQGSGDVKYHLGASADRQFDGNVVHLSLAANPSHLEAVDPVVIGKVRAKQRQYVEAEYRARRKAMSAEKGALPEGPAFPSGSASNVKDPALLSSRTKVMGVLLHGDAAFAGQGLVAETFAFSQLRGYSVGGTLHFIVNNQIGFTTSPKYSRSSPYPSDVAKMVQAPIFHVNGDDPEAVVHAARVATEFRQKFHADVVIDLFCYRRFGHNEGDEPHFTQPLMYRAIGRHPTVVQQYSQQLIAEGVVDEQEVQQLISDFHGHLDTQFAVSKNYRPNQTDWLGGVWSGMEAAPQGARRGDTACTLEMLQQVGRRLTEAPPEIAVHPKITRQMAIKRRNLEEGRRIDWALAEALAFGTLVSEGDAVRLSGQDSGRGTFSQRHAVLVDQETESRYVPLANLRPDQGIFEVFDSPLSEASVLGFEYGYSLSAPNTLVLWEAQFGDFANGAQVILDQFISPGEHKWLRLSGLVLLLPHGYEGQGPEHSSARLERYLQMCGEDNWQVINPSTPANYFHVLRRQLRRNFRKPLIVMTPKSLLRHKGCVSDLADMGPGTFFRRVLMDVPPEVPDSGIRRVVLCSGKVYYDLLEARQKKEIKDIVFIRIEQLYPFPRQTLMRELARFPQAQIFWCQEEPSNMGAWTFVDRRLEDVLIELGHTTRRPRYVGRSEAAAPATGLFQRHVVEQQRLVSEAVLDE